MDVNITNMFHLLPAQRDPDHARRRRRGIVYTASGAVLHRGIVYTASGADLIGIKNTAMYATAKRCAVRAPPRGAPTCRRRSPPPSCKPPSSPSAPPSSSTRPHHPVTRPGASRMAGPAPLRVLPRVDARCALSLDRRVPGMTYHDSPRVELRVETSDGHDRSVERSVLSASGGLNQQLSCFLQIGRRRTLMSCLVSMARYLPRRRQAADSRSNTLPGWIRPSPPGPSDRAGTSGPEPGHRAGARGRRTAPSRSRTRRG